MISPWDYIHRVHQGLPVGSVLDAGSGRNSASWTSAFAERCWTAVTACPDRAAEVRLGPRGRLVLGSWTDQSLLRGEVYDVVLAHYLLGALERFSPYFEDRLFARLRPLVGSRLYVVGLEPVEEPSTEEERAVSQLMSFRDACYLLNGSRTYREYPLNWVVEKLSESGFRVLESRRFPNFYGVAYIKNLVQSCLTEIQHMDQPLADGLRVHLFALEEGCLQLLKRCGTLWWSSDYVIVCEPE